MKFTKNKKNNTHKKGFTIIETLVAIFILLISTTGPLAFAQNGLRASFLARDQIVAFYLAQEALETLKNLRDNASLDTTGWLTKFGPCKPEPDSGAVCGLSVNGYTSNDVDLYSNTCTSGRCAPLYYNETTKRFTNNNGPDNTISKYSRTIFVNEVETDREIQIIIEVVWESNFFGPKKIVAQENIYNWINVNQQ